MKVHKNRKMYQKHFYKRHSTLILLCVRGSVSFTIVRFSGLGVIEALCHRHVKLSECDETLNCDRHYLDDVCTHTEMDRQTRRLKNYYQKI